MISVYFDGALGERPSDRTLESSSVQTLRVKIKSADNGDGGNESCMNVMLYMLLSIPHGANPAPSPPPRANPTATPKTLSRLRLDLTSRTPACEPCDLLCALFPGVPACIFHHVMLTFTMIDHMR